MRWRRVLIYLKNGKVIYEWKSIEVTEMLWRMKVAHEKLRIT